MRYFYHLALTCAAFLCCFTITSYATHEVGYSLTYRFLAHDSLVNKDQYEVNAIIYRDMSGIAMQSSFQVLVFEDNAPAYTPLDTFELFQHSVQQLSPKDYVCVYDSLFNSFAYQIEEYRFSANVWLPTLNNHMILMASSCCRNFGIINLANNYGICMYTEIGPGQYQNTAPIFEEPIAPIICKDYPIRLSNLVTEPDGDSLVYSIVAPLDQSTHPSTITPVAYFPGYNKLNPFGTHLNFILNPTNGILEFEGDAVGLFEVSIAVKEYRNGIMLSEVRKEMQVMVYDCQYIQNNCVWPGDANNDNYANVFDVVHIVNNQFQSGIPRFEQNVEWYAHNAVDWAQTMLNGTNMKYADCDGDGIITIADTAGVSQNYGYGHTKGSEQSRMGVPVTVHFDSASYQSGDIVTGVITIGTDAQPAIDVFGIALQMEFNTLLVDSGSLQISYPSSWLGQPQSEVLTFDYANHRYGTFDFALVRLDNTNHGGFGDMIQFSFVVPEVLPDSSDMDFEFQLKESLMVNSSLQEKQIGWEPAEVTLTQQQPNDTAHSTNAIPIATANKMLINPNPAHQSVIIQLGQNPVQGNLHIYNNTGSLVRSIEINDRTALQLSTLYWSNGLYYLQFSADGIPVMATKLMVIH